jgi:hypothetical protein
VKAMKDILVSRITQPWRIPVAKGVAKWDGMGWDGMDGKEIIGVAWDDTVKSP